MISIRSKIPLNQGVTPGRVNSIVSEVQAHFNRIAVVREMVNEPKSDYFWFDSATEKLYLVTIEGELKEIGFV